LMVRGIIIFLLLGNLPAAKVAMQFFSLSSFC